MLRSSSRITFSEEESKLGTNYYWQPPESICDSCGHSTQSLHIGKSSAGWVFALHVIPEQSILTLEDWERTWRDGSGGRIEDEYGRKIDLEEMRQIITKRSFPDRPSRVNPALLERNGAIRGPHGLIRSRVGANCLAHGEGTWDLHRGEFA